jgi:small subunit ribosomal protein S6
MRTYEALFVVEPTVAAREWARVPEEIDRVVKKNGGTVIQVTKWGERKLAYPIKRSKRGTYVLAYIASPEKVLGRIRSDFQLSEILLRGIVVRHEGELRKEPPRDFEIAGTIVKRVDDGAMRT